MLLQLYDLSLANTENVFPFVHVFSVPSRNDL